MLVQELAIACLIMFLVHFLLMLLLKLDDNKTNREVAKLKAQVLDLQKGVVVMMQNEAHLSEHLMLTQHDTEQVSRHLLLAAQRISELETLTNETESYYRALRNVVLN